MLDIIPTAVFEEVQTYLRKRAEAAQSGWEAASEDEDTLTGDFCGSLRTEWIKKQASDGSWQWRIQYKKFRGRGAKALEKEIGADGIFQIEAQGADGAIVTKGVLFRAKTVRGRSRGDLREQVRKMERLAPGGSAVFEFGPDGYRADDGSTMIAEIDARPTRIPHPAESIGEYLAGRFLPCKSGLRGMYYDAVRKNLILVNIDEHASGHRLPEARAGDLSRLEDRIAIRVDDGRPPSRKLIDELDRPGYRHSACPHTITHIVLYDHFWSSQRSSPAFETLAACGLWVLAFACETTADRQLLPFTAKPENGGLAW